MLARLAIITGAAEGIGAMLAEGLARRGMQVAVLDIQAEAAQRTAAHISEVSGQACIAVPVDVSDRDALMDAAAQLKAHPADWGLVWINAGVGVGAPMIGGKPAAIEWGFGVNVLGAIWTAQAFLPPLFENGPRHIGRMISVDALRSHQARQHGCGRGVARRSYGRGCADDDFMPRSSEQDIWDAARARPDKFGGPRRIDPAIAGQWKEALLPHTMWPHIEARISDDVATGGGYFTMLAAGGRHDDIAARFDALQASIVILDEKDGF